MSPGEPPRRPGLPGDAASPVPLTGRHREQARLHAVVERAVAGSGGALAVVGPPGIGKTALVEDAAAHARDLGAEVLAARATPFGSAQPFGLAAEALAPSAGDRLRLSRLLARPAAGPLRVELSSGPELRFRVVEEFLELADDRVARGPVLVVLDDVQWADAPSLLVVRTLVRRVAHLPLSVLVTARPGDGPSPLPAELRGTPELGVLPLRPLPPSAVAELVAARLGGQPGGRLLDAATEAGGNPFVVLGLLDRWERAGQLDRHGTRVELRRSWRRATGDDPTGLGSLDRATQGLLASAAVFGATFGAEDLAALRDEPPATTEAGLASAVAAGVLVPDGPGVRFGHDLVREALWSRVPPAERQRLHRLAGRILADRGEPAPLVAAHLALGAEPGDPEALAWLERAALDVASHSPGTALAFIEDAERLVGPGGLAPSLEVERIQALGWTGRAGEAAERAGTLLAGPLDGTLEIRLRHDLALSAFVRGRGPEAAAELGRAVSACEPGPLRARLRAAEALARLVALDHPGARRSAVAALDEAATLGPGPSGETGYVASARSLGRCVLSLLELFGVRCDVAVELARAGVEVARSDPSGLPDRYQPAFFLALALGDSDRPAEAAAVLAQGRAISEEYGAAWSLPLYDALSAVLHLTAGELSDATAAAESGLRLADEADAWLAGQWCHGILALVALHTGDLDRARALLSAAASVLTDGVAQFGVEYPPWAAARLDAAEGRTREALDTLNGTWDLFTDFGFLAGRHRLGPDLARLALGVGAHARACVVRDGLEHAASVANLDSYRAAALRVRGLVDADPDAAEAAVALLEGLGRPLDLGGAAEDAAGVAAANGLATRARELQEQAVEVFRAVGADADAARAETAGDLAAARPAGATGAGPSRPAARRPARNGPGAHGRPATGWSSLTPSERRVVDLVAEGMSNGEIARALVVSRRTVESHLGRVYAKLGVASRLQLATLALRDDR